MSVTMNGGTSGMRNMMNCIVSMPAGESQPIVTNESGGVPGNYQFTQNSGNRHIAETEFHEMPTSGTSPLGGE